MGTRNPIQKIKASQKRGHGNGAGLSCPRPGPKKEPGFSPAHPTPPSHPVLSPSPRKSVRARLSVVPKNAPSGASLLPQAVPGVPIALQRDGAALKPTSKNNQKISPIPPQPAISPPPQKSVRARLLVVPKNARREAPPCCRRPPLKSPSNLEKQPEDQPNPTPTRPLPIAPKKCQGTTFSRAIKSRAEGASLLPQAVPGVRTQQSIAGVRTQRPASPRATTAPGHPLN